VLVSIAYRFDKKDTDRDGIADEKDACPTQPGSVKMNSDIDGDEICDNDDSCPDVAGLAKFAPAASNATEKGCQ
jgi:OOP family OmpA-OmpF porin